MAIIENIYSRLIRSTLAFFPYSRRLLVRRKGHLRGPLLKTVDEDERWRNRLQGYEEMGIAADGNECGVHVVVCIFV